MGTYRTVQDQASINSVILARHCDLHIQYIQVYRVLPYYLRTEIQLKASLESVVNFYWWMKGLIWYERMVFDIHIATFYTVAI